MFFPKFKCFGFLFLCLLYNDAHKVLRGAPKPVPLIKNAPYIYRGQVFILRETDDSKSPFVAEIVNGGIEMVQQLPRPIPMPTPLHLQDINRIRANDTSSPPGVLEDPEYFAVIITPETAALTDISRSTIVDIPLVMLLTGIAKRMPWVLVLKRKNHSEYFRNMEPSVPVIHQIPMIFSQRRRTRSSLPARTPRLVLESGKYDLVYSEKDKAMLQNICANVVEELTFINALVQQFSNETETYEHGQYDFVDQFDNSKTVKKNESTSTNPATDYEFSLPLEQSLAKNSSQSSSYIRKTEY